MSIGDKVGRYFVKVGTGSLITGGVLGIYKIGQKIGENPIVCEAGEKFGEVGAWVANNAYWILPIFVAAPLIKYGLDKAEGLERRVRE